MKKRNQITAMGVMGAAILLVGIAFIGCGGDDNPKRKTLADRALDTIAASVADGVVDAAFASATVDENAVFAVDEKQGILNVADMLVSDSVLYAVFDGGVIVYDFHNESYTTFPVEETFHAITRHDGKVYVGGENLYVIEDTVLTPAEGLFDGEIQFLYSWEYCLMIGTDQGLYSNSIFGDITLTEEFPVNAMVADESGGLWVGSECNGLYRWNGERFQKRYLLRDTTIFDNVSALAFNHGHLYVGTDNGFFTFNGGRWQQLTITEGLPSDQVRAVDAADWVINIATDNGVISLFNGDFLRCGGLEETKVNVLCPFDNKLIAATDSDGILIKSGSTVTTLVEPVLDEKPEEDQPEETEIYTVTE